MRIEKTIGLTGVDHRHLRAAYVAHIVSAMVTFRVFGPFLFSLGRRYDKADSLFQSMSNHIRDKSTRKEAVWRQQTLLAAFTSSGAKQRINTAAGTVVDEIVAEIKHFADPKEEEGIKIAVRRIVKLAAETWRFARLERELIIATMPAVHDDKHEFAGPEYWSAYRSEETPIASLADIAHADERPRLLLRLFPVIHREPKHENFRSSKDEKPDEGCVYHHGSALYADARPVEARREELRAAGLPPATHPSPTAADFPPPMIPPPSKPPPPRPTEDSESSTKPPKTSEKPRDSPTPPSKPKSLRAPYTRPAPGPVEFSKPSNAPPLPTSTEVSGKASSMAIPDQAGPASQIAPLPASMEVPTIPPPSSRPNTVSSLPESSEAAILPPPPARPTDSIFLLAAPTESGFIPASMVQLAATHDASRRNTGRRSSSENPPTPPRSRAPSPLFAAEDEIEALRPHRAQVPAASRRSTSTRDSNEELGKEKADRAETTRRTSGYSLSSKSSMDDRSEKTDRTERTEKTDRTERSSNSKYTCESRSAAIKGLYPNSPLAGVLPPSPPVRTNSLRKKKSRTTLSGGTWDTDPYSNDVHE
jgi:serine/arginine repetitive matrix protein 2